MKHTTILLFLSFTIINVKAQTTKKVQDYVLNSATKHWEAKGEPYYHPDTLTLIHGYKWKREQIIAIQDYKKEKYKWIKYGQSYAIPDTLKLIHAFVK